MVTENVPGCPKHPDFVLLKEEADKHGYVLVCSGIHDVHAVHPIVRERWLGVWCLVSEGLELGSTPYLRSSYRFVFGFRVCHFDGFDFG